MKKMINQFKKTIKKYNLINKGDRILIGLSGGADSVCLALLLNEIKDEYDLKLSAVHINHLLRGDEATRDMDFCVDFCKKNNIPLKTFEVDIKNLCKEAKKGVEEFAREKRYEIFERESDGGKIATAHNLDDVAETLIFNITRGTGIKGVCSIPAKRDNIIRPLIEISRKQEEEYLKQKNQNFVIDSTNADNEYSRNKIRNVVIPALKSINPSFLQSVLRLKDTSEKYVEYFKINSQMLYNENVSQDELKNKPSAEIYEYLSYFALSECGLKLDKFHLDNCVEVLNNGGKTSLPENKSFFVKDGQLFIKEETKEIPKTFEFSVENEIVTPYNKYNFEIISKEEFEKNKNVYNLFLNSIIDYDKICDSPVLRNRKSGDKIKLKHRPKKLVKAIYNEYKISPKNRFKLAVLVLDDEIVWAENIGVSEKYCPNKNTKVFLKVTKEVDYH